MLTDEQKKELEKMYSYQDKANYTEEEFELARKMFDTPEKFGMLRRILQVLGQDERGLLIPSSSQSFVDTPITELHKYAIESAVNHLADEKVRQLLFSFHRLLKTHIVKEKTKEMEAQNQKDEDEKNKKEEYEKNKDKEVLNLGKNL